MSSESVNEIIEYGNIRNDAINVKNDIELSQKLQCQHGEIKRWTDPKSTTRAFFTVCDNLHRKQVARDWDNFQ